MRNKQRSGRHKDPPKASVLKVLFTYQAGGIPF